tara:strand:+ start:103 stop:876 length:774 start_codon:yes stop_codon:yes gene_type:complete
MNTIIAEVPEDIATLDSINVEIHKLTQPLFDRLQASGKSKVAEASWNKTVLALVKWALSEPQEDEKPRPTIGQLYDLVAEVLASRVVGLGSDTGMDGDAISKLEKLAANTVSQLNGQFYAIARTLKEDGVDGIQGEIDAEKATWGSVKKYAAGRVEAFAYAEDRHGVNVSYTPQGTDHAVTFTVGQALKTRNAYTKSVKTAEALRAENAPRWSAVLRDDRSKNPSGMIDRRNKSDDAALGMAIRQKLDPDKIAELLK